MEPHVPLTLACVKAEDRVTVGAVVDLSVLAVLDRAVAADGTIFLVDAGVGGDPCKTVLQPRTAELALRRGAGEERTLGIGRGQLPRSVSVES